MSVAERWLRRPQSVWLRKALFQIHLWTGIGLGLYVFAISVSGSAIVFRNDLYKALGPKPVAVAGTGARLSRQELKAAAEKAHPRYHVSYIWPGKRAKEAVEIWLQQGNKQKQRLFDPYTGADLGPSVPYSIRVLAWLSDLHTNLLAGKKGRLVNGAGAVFLTLLCGTGAIVWWPGIGNWRRSLTISRRATWKRFNWELHSAAGFWTFALSLMWGVTGIYVVYPEPFQRLVGIFVVPDIFHPRTSPDAQILRWLTRLHFGNFGPGDWPLKTVWVVLGLAPAMLFVTGAVMWWNRVVAPAGRRAAKKRTDLTIEVPVESK